MWGSNGILTHDLRDTSAMLYRLSYEASTGAGHGTCLLRKWLLFRSLDEVF